MNSNTCEYHFPATQRELNELAENHKLAGSSLDEPPASFAQVWFWLDDLDCNPPRERIVEARGLPAHTTLAEVLLYLGCDLSGYGFPHEA